MTTKLPAISGYRFVRDEVLHRIRSGTWGPGTLLPGETDLAEEFGMARATVNRAMQELTASGYIERKRKGGTRVRERPLRSARFNIPLVREEIEASGFQYGYRLLLRTVSSVEGEVSAKLGSSPKSKHLHLFCLHLASAEPYQVEERWINLQTLPEAKDVDFSTDSPNAWLVDRVPFTDVELAITSVLPSAAVAQALDQAPTQPCLMFERVTWMNDKSVTLVRLYFRDGYRLVTQY